MRGQGAAFGKLAAELTSRNAEISLGSCPGGDRGQRTARQAMRSWWPYRSPRRSRWRSLTKRAEPSCFLTSLETCPNRRRLSCDVFTLKGRFGYFIRTRLIFRIIGCTNFRSLETKFPAGQFGLKDIGCHVITTGKCIYIFLTKMNQVPTRMVQKRTCCTTPHQTRENKSSR